MLEVTVRARRSEAEVPRLTTENTNLLHSNNKLGEENFKLKDTAAQLGRRLEAEESGRKEAEENFEQAAAQLEKKTEDLLILEDNYAKAYNNGFDAATKDFEEQIPGVTQNIWACR
ncbi:hypothetical protein RHGRI_011557 [Rhododendron griersonianum]|uniref:Tropomyosin n=1 Tax=Rhododendron griersonianum TaxID=479676 RepID=A0AAV6KNA9_9ERIC|nr:hypothetical protein RHGRI_011557 [Rhododendron griersonianum]